MKKKSIVWIVCIMLLLGMLAIPVYAIPNNNPALKELKSNVGELNPKFDYLTIDYSIVVPSETEKIEITAVPEEETSTVTITGNENLELGLNTIEVLVTAEDGTSRTYTIRVTRGDVEKANTNLKSLTIGDYNLVPEFNNGITEYVLPIPKDVTSIEVEAVPESDGATVQIEGQENITGNDQMVTVLVTAEDGITQKQFNIIVTKGETESEKWQEEGQVEENTQSTEKPNFWFAKYMAFAIIVVIVLVVLLRIIQVKRAKQEKVKEKTDDKN